jgi:folylpolyglutamate synthase/dihydropteroate synthase
VKSFHPRAADPVMLVNLVDPFNVPVEIIQDVAEGIQGAIQQSVRDAVVLVTGSIFVVAGARMYLRKNWSGDEK